MKHNNRYDIHPRMVVSAFRDEDGMERCPFCPGFTSASETALDGHIQHEHAADEWQAWLHFNGRTK